MALARWQATIVDEQGNVMPNAQVQVVRESTGSLPQLFADRDGTVTLGNPVTADAQGYVALHVVGGAYRITASASGVVREWRYVGIGTSQETDIEEIASYLMAGITPAQTRADLLAVEPESFPAGGMVLADPVGANNGYYVNSGAGWVYSRPLPDTIARAHIVSGGVNTPTASIHGGINPSSPAVLFLDVSVPNTGPVTLTVTGLGTGPVYSASGDLLSPGEWQGRVMLTREETGGWRILNDPASALSAALSASQAESARVAAEGQADRATTQADRAESAANGVSAPVSYLPQTLTTAQQAQARANINVVGTTTATVGAAIAGASQKATPADGDRFAGVLAGGSEVFWTTWANLRAALPLATAAVKGLMSPDDKSGLDQLIGSGMRYRGLIPESGAHDLNDYVEAGFWSQDKTVGAQAGTNYPVRSAGLLEVIAVGTSNIQTIQRYTAYSFALSFTRMQGLPGVWSEWREELTNEGTTGLGGFTSNTFNLGNSSGRTIKPKYLDGNYQTLANNGNFTLQAPDDVTGNSSSMLIRVNGNSGGAMTATGFSVVQGELGTSGGHYLTIRTVLSYRVLTIERFG